MTTPFSEEVTATAARLVVEDGLEYGAAKRKAARALGRKSTRANELPSNQALEDEVREYLSLFYADSQPAELRALRELAAGWMERLAEFRPHLGGAVWRGTATRRSALMIDLYCDDTKSTEIMLINAGIRFDSEALDGHEEATPVLTVSASCPALGERVPIHLIVRDFDELRGALRADGAGRSWRGDLAALRRRLQEEGAP